MPPRYTKTEMAVINWIAQSIGRNPRAKFIHLSYSDDLALDNSSKTKELIQSDEYQDLWPITLKDDSQSKKKWYTKEGGGLYATAAGGSVTGFGAGSTSESGFHGAIIIDDPIKVDDADRELERTKINNRLNSTIKSRRNNRDTPIIIIMQRLHEDDMSGFVLDGGMGEDFYHLKLPALSDGKALWPYKHTVEELEVEKVASPVTFSGQMQQEPSPLEGSYFKRDWFKRFKIGEQPDRLIKYGAGDYAVTDSGGDYSEQGIGGFDKDDDLWLVDWWSGQTESDVWVDEMLELGTRHETIAFVGEKGQIEKSIKLFLKKEMRRQKKYLRIETISHGNKDKPTNARSFQALASQGKVHIPLTPWGEDLITQLLKFPNGKYDDKVDVCGLFGKILDQTYAPSEVKPQEPENNDDYETDDDDEEGNWKTA